MNTNTANADNLLRKELKQTTDSLRFDLNTLDGFTRPTEGVAHHKNAELTVINGTIDVTGTTTVNGTLTVAAGGTYSAPADAIVVNGVLDAPGGNVIASFFNIIAGGLLSGTGFITGLVNVDTGATIMPGASPGTLTIFGDYQQASGATLIVELGGLTQGSTYDLLNVSGTATLDGILDIQLFGGFTGSVGDQFDIISSSNVINDFATIIEPGGTTFLASANVPSSGIYQLEITSGAAPPPPPPVPEPTQTVTLNEEVIAFGTDPVIVINEHGEKVALAGSAILVLDDDEDDEEKRELVCR